MSVLPKEPLQPGAKLGAYKVTRLINLGPIHAVYAAVHEFTGKNVAVKILLPDAVTNSVNKLRTSAGARAMASINCEGVVTVYDLGVTPEGLAYTVMDLVEGRTMDTILKEDGPLSAPRIRRLFGQIAVALEAVHKKNIVHRDLCPAHFIVSSTEEEKVTLIDFTLCRTISSPPAAMTLVGEIIGNPDYMSPEQCMGLEADQHSDIFALGCCMFEAMTGSKPAVGATMIDTMARQVASMPRMPDDQDSEYKGLSAVVLKCLSKQPEDRYQSMEQLHRDLVGDKVKTRAAKSWRDKFS